MHVFMGKIFLNFMQFIRPHLEIDTYPQLPARRLRMCERGPIMTAPVDDESARALRRLWFDYLDVIAPFRPRLHSYCLKLTGSIFDAEDLLQETLLKGFSSIGRGEFASEHVPDPRAYICLIATNAWIDEQRKRIRAERSAALEPSGGATREITPITPALSAALFERASPQERAAVVLKDVFDFSLEEIADVLSTSTGPVKSALH